MLIDPKHWIETLKVACSGEFDSRFYLLRNDDVRRARQNPLRHYMRFGWKEGRDPSANFSTNFYLQNNPDVRQSGTNPLLHYVRFGKKEGRLPKEPAASIRRQAKPRPSRRALYNTLRRLYFRLPLTPAQRARLRGFLMTRFPNLFQRLRAAQTQNPDVRGFIPGSMVDIDTVPRLINYSGEIAIHIHIYYEDLISEFASYLSNIPLRFDLFISVITEAAAQTCRETFAGLPALRKLTIKVVPNRGRDLGPFVVAFGPQLRTYDIIAHFHTKKSLYNEGATEGWREYLLNQLLGSGDRIQQIFSLLTDETPFGMVYPQTYHLVLYQAHTWLANRALAEHWAGALGLTSLPRGYFDFPAGSMFWARAEALAPLFEAGISLEDFPPESGQTDGTLAHMLERMLGVCVLNQGFHLAIFKDKKYPSWSAWRLDQVIQRRYEDVKSWLTDGPEKLIGLDVFDTLLSKTLLDPEFTKKIVARRSAAEVGELFHKFRAEAEAQARAQKGADVGLDEVYARLGELTQLGAEELAGLRELEESVEVSSVRPREEGLGLFRSALATGRPVALITDTFLPKKTVEGMLTKAGLKGWDKLFVSNAEGVRKDSGQLFEHVRKSYQIAPEDLVILGDNERSDIQIPWEQGSRAVPVLRPVEMARGNPRLAELVDQVEKRNDLDEALTLGQVILHNYSQICYPGYDPVSLFPVSPQNWGYSLVGPLLVSFSQWLFEQARADGIDCLHFLSREGKIMKAVYDAWVEGLPGAPRSQYAVLSRRSSSMAALSSFEEIIDIAKTNYFTNTFGKMVQTRYGISPSQEKWQEVRSLSGYSADTLIEIQNKKIGNLREALRSLEPEIMRQSQAERDAMRLYLQSAGFPEESKPAVVDVGYGGTVQGHLNKILAKPVHGYYFMTEDRASAVIKRYGVRLRACFIDQIDTTVSLPLLFWRSFDLEKLLSSNDPQIEYYEMEAGQAVGHYRPLADEELAASEIRNQILAGALQYTADLREIRQNLLPDIQPSSFVATSLMDAFLTNQSDAEIALLSSIVLDDYYCGRDLVA